MKKADKSIWNNTWNKSQYRVSIGNMDILIFREITKFIDAFTINTTHFFISIFIVQSVLFENTFPFIMFLYSYRE